MKNIELNRLEKAIRDVPDFPKPGIIFKDITPVLADAELFSMSVQAMASTTNGAEIDKVVGIESRGFIFGSDKINGDHMSQHYVPKHVLKSSKIFLNVPKISQFWARWPSNLPKCGILCYHVCVCVCVYN